MLGAPFVYFVDHDSVTHVEIVMVAGQFLGKNWHGNATSVFLFGNISAIAPGLDPL
jgi:hypothetical protein